MATPGGVGPVPEGKEVNPAPEPMGPRVASPLNRTVPVAAARSSAPRLGEGRVGAAGQLSVWPPVTCAHGGGDQPRLQVLCREYGAGLYVSEMITARGYLMETASRHWHPRPRTSAIGTGLRRRPRRPRRDGAGLVDEGVDHLDINMGCPVPKVTRAGEGAIPCAEAAGPARGGPNAGDVPVTVKMRKGIHDRLLTFEEAGAAEEGASAVGLHAGTAAELYSGEAD